MKKLIHHGILVGTLLVGAALPLGAQQPPQPPDNTGGTNQWTGHHHRHAQWKAMHEQMAAEIKAQDAQLEQLVTQMNNAPPDQKADAVAAVVNQLVEDRLTMHQKWESMHQQMGGTNAPPNQGTGTTPPSP